MSRLTEPRVEGWITRLEKAHSLLEQVRNEQRTYYQSAKGGRFSDLAECLTSAKDASHAVEAARGWCVGLLAGERRRKA